MSEHRDPPPHNSTPVTLAVGVSPHSETWVQVPRKSMEAMGQLIGESPAAGQLLIAMTARMGHHNAIVASYATLMEITGLSRSTIARAVSTLKKRRFISIVQIGATKSAQAFVINDRVAWYGPRDGIRHSLFSAAVIGSSTDQPDMAELESSEPMVEIPAIYRGEQQLPTGDGLPPPSEPALPGFEADLPGRQANADD